MLPRKSTQTPTMPFKEEENQRRIISRFLFMAVDGKPMRFFVRRGPAKVTLHTHILAGGGVVCKSPEPGAVLLLDPRDVWCIAKGTDHWYVSVQYIRDCLERNEQLDLENYRMKPNATDAQFASDMFTDNHKGRTAYTPEEDAAIINYVSARKGHKGMLLWKEMESMRVTQHSWNSMKYRYLSKLMHMPAQVQDDGSRDGESQQTLSPMKSDQAKKKPKMVASPVMPQRRSLRHQMTPPLDTPSRKKARTSLPCSSPKASPSSRPPPPQLTESHQSADEGANAVTQKEAETSGKRKEIIKIEDEDDSKRPTMPSKLENPPSPQVLSPVLFMAVDGTPMRFFLRPGPTKVMLRTHILAGGGAVCQFQEPGAVLLLDPRDVVSLAKGTDHWYVSVQYIWDCIEKNEQLDLEDYRMKPNTTDAQSAKKTSCTDISTGRTAYTPEEDAAIISYVSRRKGHKGLLLWKEMESKRVTQHSWQSMKHRYLSKLMDMPAQVQEDGSRDGDSETEDLSIEAGNSGESTNIESPTAGSPPDPDMTPEEEEEEEAPPVVLAEVPQNTLSPMKSDKTKKLKMEASPVIPLRHSLRRQMLPHTPPSDTPPSDTPSTKKARTLLPCSSPKASTSAASPSSRPPPPQPPPPRLTESHQSADEDANPVTQKEVEARGKRKEKRKLGLLEMATKEFESEDDSEDPRESTSKQPTGMPDVAMETRTVVETGSAPKPYLFIFDSESLEEGSQPMDCDDDVVPAGPRPISEKAEVVSLTQAQLKQDMQRIRELIKQTNQDLVSVTKALLKTSGDFSAALALLLDPALAQGPFWSRCDDRLLLTSDPEARRELQKRYGEQGVAKRLMFLNGGW